MKKPVVLGVPAVAQRVKNPTGVFSTPSLGTSICPGRSPKQKQTKTRVFNTVISFLGIYSQERVTEIEQKHVQTFSSKCIRDSFR